MATNRFPYRCRVCRVSMDNSTVLFVGTDTFCANCCNAYEYRISFSDGSAWYLKTDEDPLEVCEGAGLLDRVVDVKTIAKVGA